MKKLLTCALVMMMALVSAFAVVGCNAPTAKLKVKDIELTSETYAFAINKENTALKDSVNEILANMTEDGRLAQVIDSFFTGDATFTYENPDAPTPDKRDSFLIVGTNAYFPPFEMYQGVKFTGVDMQIASMIAEELDKTLYIKDMDFDGLIPSVVNKEIDIAMAGMTVNEERLQQVDFSTGYYTSAQVITVLESDTTFDACKTGADVEEILKAKSKDYKVGTQKGTTGYMYSAGDEGFGYDGFTNITTKAYDTGALAMQDLKNGKINAVILDKQPSLMITKSING